MSALFHVDQATADCWRADGRFVLFGEGAVEPNPNRNAGIVGRRVPPAAMIEAAKPCGCDNGMIRLVMNPETGERFPCQHCSNGQRRHPVTVPCPHDCERFGGRVPGHARGSNWDWVPCWCDGTFRITVARAVVEWGPLVISDIDANCPADDHLYVDWANIGGERHVFLSRCIRGDATDDEWDLPPDVDPASLVGQWAIGIKVVEP